MVGVRERVNAQNIVMSQQGAIQNDIPSSQVRVNRRAFYDFFDGNSVVELWRSSDEIEITGRGGVAN